MHKFKQAVMFGANVYFEDAVFGAMLEPGRDWYVNAKLGNDEASGTSWGTPFLTMERAFEVIKSGDRINFVGKVREQLVAPVGIFGVTIRGASTFPRHADNHTEGANYMGGSMAATWVAPASPTATTALLRLQQQGWKLENFLMGGHTDFCAVEIVRNAAADDSERDGSWAQLIGIRFAGGQDGIRFGATSFTENVHGVVVKGCTFNDQTGTSILGAAGGTRRIKLLGNTFMGNANSVDAPLVQSEVIGNIFGLATTKNLDLTGGSDNNVTGNYFSGDYSTASGSYVAGTNDNWFGNIATDVAEDEVDAAGNVTAVPAA